MRGVNAAGTLWRGGRQLTVRESACVCVPVNFVPHCRACLTGVMRCLWPESCEFDFAAADSGMPRNAARIGAPPKTSASMPALRAQSGLPKPGARLAALHRGFARRATTCETSGSADFAPVPGCGHYAISRQTRSETMRKLWGPAVCARTMSSQAISRSSARRFSIHQTAG